MSNLEGRILDFLNYDNDDKLNLEVSLLKGISKQNFKDIIKVPYIDGKTADDFVEYLANGDDLESKYGKKTKFRGSEQIALAQLYSNIFLGTNLKVDGKLGPKSISSIKNSFVKKDLKNTSIESAEDEFENLIVKDGTKIENMNLKGKSISIKINSKKTKESVINSLRKLKLPYEEMSNLVADIHFGKISINQTNGKYLFKGKELILNKGDIIYLDQSTKKDNVDNINKFEDKQNSINSSKEHEKLEYNSQFAEKRTKESVSTLTDYGFFNKGIESSRSEEFDKLSSESKASLSIILKSSNLEKISQELKQAAPKDGIFKIGNHKQVEEILTKYGYEFDSYFGVDEVSSVYATIIDYAETQSLIPSLDNKHKLQLLLDFNKDGKLGKEINNVVGELQSYFIVNESLSSDGIDIFMQNLGLGFMKEFSLEMSNNLYSSREKFQRILGTMVEMKIKPTELVKANGVNLALEDVYKNEKNISSKISKHLDEDDLLKSKLYTLRDVADLNEINRIIKLEAVGAYVGSNHGVGASFDVKKFVRGFVDSIQVGMINGTLGVSFTKQILEKNGFKAGVGLANFCIPLIGASYTYHNPKLKELFSNKLDGNYKPSIYAGISTVGQTIGINIEKAGIEDNLKLMESNLDIIQNDLKNGNNFPSSEFSKISVNKENDEKIYEELKRFYEVNGKGKDFEDKLLDSMSKSYLHYYENLLYSNEIGGREGKLNITSVGGGVALVAGFMPIPYMTIGGEYLSQRFAKTHLRYESERDITYTKLNKDKVGLKILENYNGKRVFTIPSTFQSKELNFKGEYNFSTPDGKVQAELVNGKYYFSSKDIQSISIDENIVSDKVERTIVINGGKLDENGLFVAATMTNIVDSLPSNLTRKSNISENNKYEDSIDTLNEENIEKTKIIRESIFNLISKSTINSPHSNDLISLQKMIFELGTGQRNDVDIIWQAFHKFVFVSDFKKYAQETSNVESLNNLKSKLREGVFNEEQKILILQTIPACLMKNSKLLVKGGEVNVGKTISDYDKRGNFFDRLFHNSLPGLSNSLKIARKEWFDKNGDKTSYKFKTVADGSIAYVGTETVLNNGKKNISGLMQYSNIYNVVDAGTPFIQMPVKSFEIVNSLPILYLQNLMNSLNKNHGMQFNSIGDLKNFINNGGDKGRGIRFDYKLAYCKMGECMNDAIVIKDMKLMKSGGEMPSDVSEIPLYSTATSEVYSAVNNKLVWGVGVTGSSKDKDNGNRDEPKDDNPRTDPDVSNDRPNISPGNNIDE
ncbi:MAG: hypothetical protein V3575_00190 [Candidatus Absconditabacteria bacterium]